MCELPSIGMRGSAAYTRDVENIRQDGCEYFVLPMFGPYEEVSKVLKSFAPEVVPSFS